METKMVRDLECVVIHLVIMKDRTPYKFCDGLLYQPPSPDDPNPKTLCDNCQRKVLRSQGEEEKIFDWTAETSIETAVGEAVGAASVCWETLEDAGVFDSTRASRIVKELVEFFQTKQPIY